MARGANLRVTVVELLSLLDKVEGSQADIPSVGSQLGNTFVKRLREVADLVERQLIDDHSDHTRGIVGENEEDDESSEEEYVTPSAKKGKLSEIILIHSDDDNESPRENLSMSSEIQFPSQEQSRSSSLCSRIFNPQPVRVDECAKKNQRDAEKVVDRLGKQLKNYTCGVSYPAKDEKEKNISDGIKRYLKNHLPALTNNRQIFHYMAWAATERLECDHCRKCPNEQ